MAEMVCMESGLGRTGSHCCYCERRDGPWDPRQRRKAACRHFRCVCERKGRIRMWDKRPIPLQLLSGQDKNHALYN
jgi:hypothetical protein